MTTPSIDTFGIVTNPLLFTPFITNNSPFFGGDLSDHDFLLMDGEFFLLMDGTNFLLMGT